MKKRVSAAWVFGVVAGISLVLLSGLRAHGSSRVPIYNSATETTISGAIVQTPTHSRMGLQLTVETPDGVVEVGLGPSRFIAAQGFSFAAGDSVNVTGSRIVKNGSPVFIAGEVIKDGKRLILRDHGNPRWLP